MFYHDVHTLQQRNIPQRIAVRDLKAMIYRSFITTDFRGADLKRIAFT